MKVIVIRRLQHLIPYLQTDTIQIPAGTQIVGEAWSVILGSGSSFNDQTNPKPVVQVGAPGSTGTVEISDILFKTRGPSLSISTLS